MTFTGTGLIFIGLALGMIVVVAGLSVWAVIIATKCSIEIGGMNRSTHTIQYVDPSKQGQDDLAKAMAEAEGEFYEGHLDDRRDHDGPAL